MTRFPYGISNFKQLVTEGYLYVDRTAYLEKLENMPERYLFFLRPRRFGKSLFVSLLHYYYGKEHRADFQQLFGKYYVGQHPTPEAGSRLVFSIQFSGVDTSTPENTFRDFLMKIRESALNFMHTYREYFTAEDEDEIVQSPAPNNLLNSLLGKVFRQAKGQKMYVLIDEYDHFANELLAFDFDHFLRAVGQNGFVRKFYEILKEGTHSGVIDRIFITGVSPVTLDSMTSGFNIAANYSLESSLNEMMGFREEEVAAMLRVLDPVELSVAEALTQARQWYNGYLFHPMGKERIYNPDMILYFTGSYQKNNRYPERLLDENIASDYSKIRNMFRIRNKERENLVVLVQALEQGSVTAALTRKFSFETEWTPDNFASLLFYLGILTVERSEIDRWVFRIPNFVIRQLYFDYFLKIMLQNARLDAAQVNIADKISALAQQDDIQPLLELTQNILSQLATEDRAHFSEAHVKTIFTSLFYQVGYFNIFSELEVRKSQTEKGRLDLLLTRRPPFEPNFQFAFELKYLPKSQKHRLEEVKKEAKSQLEAYLANDDRLKKLDALKGYAVVFLAEKGIVMRVR